MTNSKTKRGSVTEQEILNCQVKDSTGLNDFQKLPEQSGLAIDKVGINRFRIPMSYPHKDGTIVNHDTIASMYVTLASGKTGINMSRLPLILIDETQKDSISLAFVKNVLDRYRSELRDDKKEELIDGAFLKLRFSYPIKQNSLMSNNWGWQYYECELEGKNIKGQFQAFLTVNYEYSSTCPCSASMARQYEQEYKDGQVQVGTGLATAHAQRSRAKVTIQFDPSLIYYIEDLVALLKRAIPTETQVAVKRVDEQFFAILNGEHPMFVEHATRRLSVELNADPKILDWVASVEHYESLHSHNAIGVISKGLVGGLR